MTNVRGKDLDNDFFGTITFCSHLCWWEQSTTYSTRHANYLCDIIQVMHLSVLEIFSQRHKLWWTLYKKGALLSLWLWMEALYWSHTHMTNQCNLVRSGSCYRLDIMCIFFHQCPDLLFLSMFLDFSWKWRYTEIFGYCVCQPPSHNALRQYWVFKQWPRYYFLFIL